MSRLVCSTTIAAARQGLKRIYYMQGLNPREIFETIKAPGEPLKESSKARVRRIGDWVVKESCGPWATRLLRHTVRRNRYRQAWYAAHHLRSHGVGIPEPVAYIEHGFAGLVMGNVLISEYLPDCRNVERFLLAVVQRGGGQDTVRMFLKDLAESVNRLTASGAYHADLSGKNILTRDGTTFFFIDLDAVSLGAKYTEEMRFKNHVQLYDSFCDLLNDTMLVPFIEHMLPPGVDPRIWMPKVRKGQHERRLRMEKIWARQGKLAT